MNKLFKKIIFVAFVFSLLLGTRTIYAQSFNLYSSNDIFAEIVPEIPGPNEEVYIKLKSYTFNLNNYYISWYLNGQKQSADYGNREFTFTTGPVGSVKNVTAVIDVDGQTFKKEYHFSPSEVDLLWEAVDAYTPPFYRGKAIPLKQAQIRISAIPETQLIAPSDASKLVYYWDRHYKRDIDASGFGKDSYTFEADPLRLEEKIKVTMNDRRENSFAENIITIPTKQDTPTILFYKINDKDRILTNKALNNNQNIKGDTVKLAFEPLNMSTTKPNFVDIFLKWMLNGKVQPPQDFAKQNELYITSGGKSGEIKVGVEVEGIKKLLQKGKQEINLLFDV